MGGTLAGEFGERVAGASLQRRPYLSEYRVVLHFAGREEKINETEAPINLVALASPHWVYRSPRGYDEKRNQFDCVRTRLSCQAGAHN